SRQNTPRQTRSPSQEAHGAGGRRAESDGRVPGRATGCDRPDSAPACAAACARGRRGALARSLKRLILPQRATPSALSIRRRGESSLSQLVATVREPSSAAIAATISLVVTTALA